MTRYYLGLLAGGALCALVVWSLEPRTAAGAGLGYLLGTCASVLGLRYQHDALRRHSSAALSAFVLSFLAKLVLLVVGALVLRFASAAREHFDWTAYLLAFPCAVLIATALGSLDTLRLMKQARTT